MAKHLTPKREFLYGVHAKWLPRGLRLRRISPTDGLPMG